MVLKKKAGSGFVIKWYGSAKSDPDSYQNVTGSEHYLPLSSVADS